MIVNNDICFCGNFFQDEEKMDSLNLLFYVSPIATIALIPVVLCYEQNALVVGQIVVFCFLKKKKMKEKASFSTRADTCTHSSALTSHEYESLRFVV